ncbi:hypothetical protein [Micromonospora sp. MH33]|uniref:hypothetical protein n=1 Tax=Micromonospora sp. MH33 TaxID=1945509 RepID=UPI0011B24978|nr:hypothetical protein [Micromonospora sp. MH33]
MIGKVSAATARHRHVVLMLGLLVAGVNAAAVGFAPGLGQVLFFPLVFIALAVLALAVIGMGIRPACFVVLPQMPAFATLPPAWKVFLALGFLGPASSSVGALIRSTRAGIVSTLDVVFVLSWLVLLALLLVEAWRGHGLQIRPHGIRQSWVLRFAHRAVGGPPGRSGPPEGGSPLAASDGLRETSAREAARHPVEPERTAHGQRRRRVSRRRDPALRLSSRTPGRDR